MMWGSVNTWRACPQSRFYPEVRRHPDADEAMRVMSRVAAAWDSRTHPLRMFGSPDDGLGLESTAAETYRQVTDLVSDRALQATLEHVRRLYDHRRLRGNLRAVAFLERFETVVSQELQRRCTARSVAVPAATETPADAGRATL